MCYNCLMEEKMPKNIVILGGGYGGIRTALDVGRFLKNNDTTAHNWTLHVIDKSDSHVFTPNLYEMATVLKEDASAWNIKKAVALEFSEIFTGLPIHYKQDVVLEIDTKNKKIVLRDGQPLNYEILVLALGCETNFFNIEGLEGNSSSLKTVEHAVIIRNAINTIISSQNTGQEARIAIGGGGPTGVELAGELTRFIHKKCSFKENKNCRKIKITIFEAGDTILNGLPSATINSVRYRLNKLGVNIKEKTSILKAEKEFLYIKNPDQQEEKVFCDLLIWAGGTKISPLLEAIVAPKDKKGRCLVESSLEVKLQDAGGNTNSQHIYAIGDLICFTDIRTGKPLPGTAYIAIEEGKVVAKNIIGKISKSENNKISYSAPKFYPFAIPLGGKYAIFSFGPINMSGFLGWLVRIFIDLRYFLSILPPHKAVPFWIKSVLLMIKND